MKSTWLGVGVVSIGLLWAACASGPAREVIEQPREIDSKESITILLQHRSGLASAEAREAEARQAEDEIVECLKTTIQKSHPTTKIIPPADFRRAAFPDLSLASAPRSSEYLSILLSHPAFLERIAPLNIRYLIAVGAKTERWFGKSKTTGVAVMGRGAVVITIEWLGESNFGAVILDIKDGQSLKLSSWVTDKGEFIWGFPFLPIPIPPVTESSACEKLGQQISRYLAERIVSKE